MWCPGGHLWRGVVIKVVARQCVTSSGTFIGTLSFRVPRGFTLINRKLILMKHISLSFIPRIYFSLSICSALLTFRQRLLPSCCSASSLAVLLLVYLDVRGSSLWFTESTCQVHSFFFSSAPDWWCWFVIGNCFGAWEFQLTRKWLFRGL